MLLRLLLWVALIGAIIWLWRRATRKPKLRPEQPTAQPMVRCATCGVHVPQDQALQSERQWYCSKAHLPRNGQPRDQS
ncbi:PP0621 family protein [Stutzerimonas kirkiae]